MKESKRRELDLLAKICHQNNIPLKLATELIKAAQKNEYENISQGARKNEYEELITYLIKNN